MQTVNHGRTSNFDELRTEITDIRCFSAPQICHSLFNLVKSYGLSSMGGPTSPISKPTFGNSPFGGYAKHGSSKYSVNDWMIQIALGG